MQFLNLLLLAGAEGEGSLLSSLFPLLLIFVVFYFFMIRPQAKKAKETRKFRETMGKGDKVVTIGGIHGKIVEVKETTVVLEVMGGNRFVVEKSAVSLEFSTGKGESTLQKEAATK
ncbi:MAG: preprotein translocase subunit YajC [Bacteroidota bacterium]